jgi:hypothetical protein
MSGATYVGPLERHILPQWHFTRPEEPRRRWRACCLELYQAAAPWGPWTLFHTQQFEPQGWYNPSIPSKFISPDGRQIWLFVCGDWTTAKRIDAMYGLWMIPVTLEVT